MTDATGVGIVLVHVNGGGITRDFWKVHCERCTFSELVTTENAARKAKVEHVYVKCSEQPEPTS